MIEIPIWLSDPDWLAVWIALIALAAVGYLEVWKRKGMYYHVKTATPLLSLGEQELGVLEITHNGVPVKNVSLVVIEIVCAGREPIRDEDFHTPISISYGTAARILTVNVSEVEPADLAVNTANLSPVVSVSPGLMNHQDAFTVRALVSDYDSVRVTGRIAGIRKIRPYGLSRPLAFLLLVGIIMMGLGAVALISVLPPDPTFSEHPRIYLMLLGGAALVVAACLMEPSVRRRLVKKFRASGKAAQVDRSS